MLSLTTAARGIVSQFKKPVRVGVRGGGCSGYEYVLEVCEPSEDLEEIHPGVWIDPISAMYLENVTLEYVETDFAKGFKFINPGARTCGCGKSFTA
jgi:iron-sulfur cluster assembly protein